MLLGHGQETASLAMAVQASKGGCLPAGNHKNIFADSGVEWCEYRWVPAGSLEQTGAQRP